MGNPRPKFAVGEEVSVTCISNPDIPRTEVTGLRYVQLCSFDNWNGLYTGWIYKTSGFKSSKIEARESQLKKIPPEDRLSFGDMMEKLTPTKETA